MSGLIVLAALTVAVTDFDVEGASAFVAKRLPAMTAEAVNGAGCDAKALADDLGPGVRKDFVDCLGSAACLVSVGRTLPVDRVLTGSVRGIDGELVVQFRIVETTLPPVQRRITRRLPARLDALKEGVRQSGAALCAALKAPSSTADSELDLPPVDLPPLVAEGAAPPALDLALDLQLDAPASDELALSVPPPPVEVAAHAPVEPLPEIPALVDEPLPPPREPVVVAKAPVKEVVSMEQIRAQKAVVASTKPLPPAVERPLVIPWAWVGVVSGAVLGLVGGGLGVGSAVIAGQDAPRDAGGVVRHSITRADAMTANALATGAAVLLGAGVAAGGAGAAGLAFGDAR